MSTMLQRLKAIELELHTLETATPRNSASVDRGGLSVVDDGSVILEAGGTVYFAEGGSAVSGDYDLDTQAGWQIGTERRGSSVVVINDIPSLSLDVSTANSEAVYEEIDLVVGEPNLISLEGYTMMILQLHLVSPLLGIIRVDGAEIYPSKVIKSREEQWTYGHLGTYHNDVEVTTDLEGVSVKLTKLSVNNVS